MSWSQSRQQNIPKAKLSAKALKQKEADPRGKPGQDAVSGEGNGRGELDRKAAVRWPEALQELQQMTWGLAGHWRTPVFFFCFQTSFPAAQTGCEFTVAEGDLDSCLHLLGVETTGAHYHSLLRDWIFTGGNRSWCVRGNRLPWYLATHFSLCAFLGSLGSSGRSGFTVCSRFTLEHCVVLADFRLEVILLLQPHQYWGSQMCAITSGFCWLFRYFETEGFAMWIRLALNSQSHFSLPNAGVADACHFRSLTISPHGMKEVGFHIILAGIIQKRGENN